MNEIKEQTTESLHISHKAVLKGILAYYILGMALNYIAIPFIIYYSQYSSSGISFDYSFERFIISIVSLLFVNTIAGYIVGISSKKNIQMHCVIFGLIIVLIEISHFSNAMPYYMTEGLIAAYSGNTIESYAYGAERSFIHAFVYCLLFILCIMLGGYFAKRLLNASTNQNQRDQPWNFLILQ